MRILPPRSPHDRNLDWRESHRLEIEQHSSGEMDKLAELSLISPLGVRFEIRDMPLWHTAWPLAALHQPNSQPIPKCAECANYWPCPSYRQEQAEDMSSRTTFTF